MMQLISKKVIAFNILLLHCSISFGCFNQGEQKICDDNLLIIAAYSDGKFKNGLQKTNKFFYRELSIKNNDFLLWLDKERLTEIDIQKILLGALWRDNKIDQKIVEHYKIYYNQKEKISLKNFFGDNKFILEDKNIKCGLSPLKSSITFDEIKDSRKLLLDNGIFKEFNSLQKDIKKALQVGAFCGDVILVQSISKKIINIFDAMSALSNSPCENYAIGQLYNFDQHLNDQRHAYKELTFFDCSIESTKLLLLKLMYLNKKEMFQALVDANPFNLKVFNTKAINEWTYIVKCFQNDNIKTIDKNVNKAEYIQILEKQCVDINKKTVNNPEILCNNLSQNSKTMNNDNDEDGCVIF